MPDKVSILCNFRMYKPYPIISLASTCLLGIFELGLGS